jgi:ABC-type transport system involved in multi-copper enzyme maturation permease subunit
MFREIFRFELRQQLRSPLLWLVALVLAALACAATSSHSVTIGGGIGNVHRNAPTVVINMLGVFSVIGLFLIPIFVVGAVLRDFGANTAEMIFATPVGRGAYLGGRFAAGWLASALVLFVVAIGLWLGSLMPWLDPARLGPTSWAAYAWGMGIIALPNLLFLSALLTLVATLTRSMLATYVGVVAFFVIRIIANLALGHGNIAHQSAAALDDPFGIAALNLVTRYWTAADQNHRIPALTGLLVENRLIWLSVAAAMLGASVALFKPDRDGIRWRRRRRPAVDRVPIRQSAGPLRLPQVVLQTSISARLKQLVSVMRLDTLNVLGSTAFLVMLLFGLLNLTGFLVFSGQIFGTRVYPVTEQMAVAINDTYKWLLWIILGFYAGELVWRERVTRVNEVMDALPTPEWIPLLANVAALVVVIAVFLLVASVYCAAFQVVHGFHDIQPLLYAKFLGLNLIQFTWFAVFAVVLQTLASNKFAGYALTVVYMLALIALGQLHLSDNLYLPGIAPSTPYSDINGFGTFWVGTLWFYAYWYCLVVALLVLAALFRIRGNPDGWRARLSVARQRLGAKPRLIMIGALIGFAAIGSFIFYNTHELYRYRTHEEKLRLAADYEKAYKKFQYLAGPRITDVKLHIAMYPAQRRADIQGQYTLINRHAHPLDELLVQLPVPSTREFKVMLKFPAHTTRIANAAQGFYLYRLAQPLAPGASMTFQFHEQVAYPGFANEPTGRQIVRNGTFFTNESFPQFCYDADRQLTDNNQRRRFGLPPAQRMPRRSDARAHANTYVSCDSDWVNFSATLSTSANQVALAPGHLTKEWTVGDRRYFHYALSAPTLNFFSFQSARYKIARSRWKNVDLEVYYVGQHAYNVRRALRAMKDALAFCSKHFGPYQFRQLRIVEFPGYATYAQTFPGTIPYSHRFMLQDLRKPSDLDYVTYVTAHETSHEWWAHQAIGADVRGATMLSESLAQYSAMMVMKRLYGPLAMRKFLKYEVDQYLAGRAAERVREEPLVRVDEQQGYIDYDKAAVILYALQDYLGEDKVDAALRTWLDKVRFQQPPYTDSHDLMADLRAAAGPDGQNLVRDFFDRITLFEDRMRSASAVKLPDGDYRVTMHVHAAEYYADGKGKETRTKLDVPIEIGVFARAKDGQEQDEIPLYLQKYPVANGDSTIQVTVTGKPYQAGIDPFNELIDRVSTGKRVRVDIR